MNFELLKNKTLDEQKKYLEKYSKLLFEQLFEVRMKLNDIENALIDHKIQQLESKLKASKHTHTKSEPEKSYDPIERITKEEYQDIMSDLEGYHDIIHSIYDHYGIHSIEQLPRSELYNAKKRIKRIKKQHQDS